MKCLLLGRSTLWITPWISCHWCDIPSDGKDIFRPRWNYMGKQFSKRKFGARDAAALSLLADNFLPDTQWTFTAGLLTLSPAARVRIWLLVVGCEMGAWLRLAYCWLGWSHNNRVCWTQLEHFPNGNLVAFCIISICRLFQGRRLHTSRSRCVCGRTCFVSWIWTEVPPLFRAQNTFMHNFLPSSKHFYVAEFCVFVLLKSISI